MTFRKLRNKGQSKKKKRKRKSASRLRPFLLITLGRKRTLLLTILKAIDTVTITSIYATEWRRSVPWIQIFTHVVQFEKSLPPYCLRSIAFPRKLLFLFDQHGIPPRQRSFAVEANSFVFVRREWIPCLFGSVIVVLNVLIESFMIQKSVKKLKDGKRF